MILKCMVDIGVDDDYVGDDFSSKERLVATDETKLHSRTTKDIMEHVHFVYHYEPQYLGLDARVEGYDSKSKNHRHEL